MAWLDLIGAQQMAADAIDLAATWLHDMDDPPGEPTEVEEPALDSATTPPDAHPGSPVAVAPGCPTLHLWSRDAPACGGLQGRVLERARLYQLASVSDPSSWDDATILDTQRPMRRPSAVGIYRVLAHFAHPLESREAGADRVQLLRDVLSPGGGGERSDLQLWSEGSDFQANGLLRLLYLHAATRWAPDPARPHQTEPLIPCDLQTEAVNQLLGWKYFGDEAARHPKAPEHPEVYWSENHQLLFATAEYLAGQLLPDASFKPTVHVREGGTDTGWPCTSTERPTPGSWAVHSDPSWDLSGADRMARAYPRLVHWLDHRLMFGLSEWVSPVYSDYDIAALLNLVDFCDDRAVADKAAMVLDVLLLELARFAGEGHGPGTAGRAYPSHKFTSWGASIADTLQVVFGRWLVDERAEQILEDWRLQRVAARRSESRDACAGKARDWHEDLDHSAEVVAQEVNEALARWDQENPVGADSTRRAAPTAAAWDRADSVGAHSLATSRRYCIPTVIFRYAEQDPVGRFERSRVSVDFDEGHDRYGIDFTSPQGLLDWWSRGGFGAPMTILGSRDLADDWDVEKTSPFSDITGLFALPDAALVQASMALGVESLGSCLTTANLALWREGEAALSSVQKFRFGQVGRQAQIWQATLGPYVSVWSTYPAAKSSESDSDGPSWWSGNAAQPRVVQHDDALICVHDSNLISYTNFTYGHRSHAWFPVEMFHEAWHVRRTDPDDDDTVIITDLHSGASRKELFGLDADEGGSWWFGRWNDSYVGLFSAKDSTRLLTTGRWANREILCEDRVNVFVCQVGSKTRHGAFADFVHQCTTARIHVGAGVYQPSNPFVDIQCSYDVPLGQRLELNLEDRYPAWHGKPFSDERFPRWDTPWTQVLWGQRNYTVSAPGPGGSALTLTHDCVNGLRAGNGL